MEDREYTTAHPFVVVVVEPSTISTTSVGGSDEPRHPWRGVTVDEEGLLVVGVSLCIICRRFTTVTNL